MNLSHEAVAPQSPHRSPWQPPVSFLCLQADLSINGIMQSVTICRPTCPSMESCSQWPLVSGFFHLQYFEVHSPRIGYRYFIPFYGWIMFHDTYIPHLIIRLPTEDVWAVSTFCLSWPVLWTCIYTCIYLNTCFQFSWAYSRSGIVRRSFDATKNCSYTLQVYFIFNTVTHTGNNPHGSLHHSPLPVDPSLVPLPWN